MLVASSRGLELIAWSCYFHLEDLLQIVHVLSVSFECWSHMYKHIVLVSFALHTIIITEIDSSAILQVLN